MLNFDFDLSTSIHFGRDSINGLPQEILKYGNRILLVYDEIPARACGAYKDIMQLCRDCGIKVTEYTGIKPNPRHTAINKGVKLLKKCNPDCIVALGGGSTIDSAKAISFSAFHKGSCWDFYEKKVIVTKTIPVISIPTIAASGSEISNVSIINNMEEKRKLDCTSDMERPVAAFIDPVYTYTVPPFETACGIITIMSQAYDGYFEPDSGEIQDGIAEAIQRSCIKHGRQVMFSPSSYESRAQLLWSASLAVTHLADCGRRFDGSIHYLGQALSAFLDIPYGVSMAVMSLAWFSYMLNDDTAPRFARWGRNVWDIRINQDDFSVGKEAIKRFREFMKELHLPTRLSELDMHVEETFIRQMAEAVYEDNRGEACFCRVKSKEELTDIFCLAL